LEIVKIDANKVPGITIARDATIDDPGKHKISTILLWTV
jgi:hypothetical protein